MRPSLSCRFPSKHQAGRRERAGRTPGPQGRAGAAAAHAAPVSILAAHTPPQHRSWAWTLHCSSLSLAETLTGVSLLGEAGTFLSRKGLFPLPHGGGSWGPPVFLVFLPVLSPERAGWL